MVAIAPAAMSATKVTMTFTVAAPSEKPACPRETDMPQRRQ
jgi:hypothetical protein